MTKLKGRKSNRLANTYTHLGFSISLVVMIDILNKTVNIIIYLGLQFDYQMYFLHFLIKKILTTKDYNGS
jgi:hypothetical protein